VELAAGDRVLDVACPTGIVPRESRRSGWAFTSGIRFHSDVSINEGRISVGDVLLLVRDSSRGSLSASWRVVKRPSKSIASEKCSFRNRRQSHTIACGATSAGPGALTAALPMGDGQVRLRSGSSEGPMSSSRTLAALTVCAALTAGAAVRFAATPNAAAQGNQPRPPNIVVVLTDDQGYGDLGSYGHPTIRTPALDRLASEGQRWTSFYAAPVCTPSRAQLMTGRLAARTGLVGGVLFPDSPGGLQPEEITIAEVLKPRGYATIAIGKWHLGHLPKYLPTNQGFDSYFGVPYSNDMDRPSGISFEESFPQYMEPRLEFFNVPLMRNEKIVERPAQQATLTARYTDEAIEFIRNNRTRPFLVYLAHSMPHMPLYRSSEFVGRSPRGRYGDVIEEIDFNVGRIVTTLQELELERDTLVVFLSDNGPWAPFLEQAGSAGLLRGAKASNWEGGVRVPAIFSWPGTVARGVVTELGSELDLLPTFAKLAGAVAPTDRPLDGFDLSQTLRTGAPSPRQELFYYGSRLAAVRQGPYKLHLVPQQGQPGQGGTQQAQTGQAASAGPELYNLDVDPSEKFNLAGRLPDVVAKLQRLAAEHQASFTLAPTQLGRGGQ
jgi:arylsulfatase A-like enzyme